MNVLILNMNKKSSFILAVGFAVAIMIPGIAAKACSASLGGTTGCASPDGDSLCNSNCWVAGFSMGECGLQNMLPAGYVKSAGDTSCEKYSSDRSKNTCYCKNEKPRGCAINSDCVDSAGCHSCFNKTWYADNGNTPRFNTSLNCQNHGNAICQCVSGTCQAAGAICGDGRCDPQYENINNCPQDCTPCASDSDCVSDSGACNICLSKAWLALGKAATDNPVCLNGYGTSICACEQSLCVRKSVCGDGKCDSKYENTKNCPLDCVPTCAQACQNKGYSKSYCGNTLAAAQGLSPKVCNGNDYNLYDPNTSDCDQAKQYSNLTCCCSGLKSQGAESTQSSANPLPTNPAMASIKFPQLNRVANNLALLQEISAIRQQINVLTQRLIELLSKK